MLCEIRKRIYISILFQTVRIRVVKIYSYVRVVRVIIRYVMMPENIGSGTVVIIWIKFQEPLFFPSPAKVR